MPARLRLRHVWVLATVVAAFIGPASSPIGIPDIWWTLQSGAWMVEHHALLSSDPFTSAPHVEAPLLNLQWLAQLVYHALERAGGLELVIAATAVAIALSYALVLAATLTASGHVRLSCLAVLGAYLLGFSNLAPRPQTLAYPIFGLFLLAVMRAEWRKDTRWLWLLPPATLVWANLHGSFFTGWLLLACAAGGRVIAARNLYAARPYLPVLVGCLMAAMVTPYGPGSLLYVAGIGSNPVIRDYVTEWAPTTTAWREGVFFFLSVGALAVLGTRSRTRLCATELLVLAVFGWLAIASVRAIIWWGLATAPIVARLLGGSLPHRLPRGRERPLLNIAIAAALVAIGAMSLPWTKLWLPILPADKRGLVTDDTPVAVAAYLRSHDPPGGLMFNHQGWGGYFDWAVWPRHQAFLDGRIELHPTQVWIDYLGITFPTASWRSLLKTYGIGYAVLSRRDEAELVEDLRGDPAWRLEYEDDMAVVFSRVEPPSPGT